jgi:hypothetical protein
LIIVQVGSHFYAWASLDHSSPVCASCVARITVTHYHTQFFIAWGDLKQLVSIFLSPR